MKSWFPFTDYDFYAYLSTGVIVLFSLDYGMNGGVIILRENWSFVQIVFAVTIAYLLGQVIAGLASAILEHWVARRIIRPPVAVMMGIGRRTLPEALIGRFGRYYQPQSKHWRSVILQGVARELDKEPDAIEDPEEVFQVAFPVSRSIPDSAARMDEFRRLYGFCRNVALAGLISTVPLVHRATVESDDTLYWWAVLVFILSIGMFFRFLKFYADFAGEVLRTYASRIGGKQE